jgi:hypothetical protein
MVWPEHERRVDISQESQTGSILRTVIPDSDSVQGYDQSPRKANGSRHMVVGKELELSLKGRRILRC